VLADFMLPKLSMEISPKMPAGYKYGWRYGMEVTDAGTLSKDRALLNPTLLVALMAVYQVGVWTLVPALTYSAMPLDVVEGYMWGREWLIATDKHPALPSWVLEMSRLATGAVGWPAYLISQLFTAATFIFVFLLGRELLGSKRAAAGTLLLTSIAFYAWPTVEFNHNVAQTLFWAVIPWAIWRAVQQRRFAWWMLAGAMAAGGVYAKLTTVLLLMTLFAWMLRDRDARRCLVTPGPWIGLALFVVLTTPLTLWLVANDFAPLKYAVSRLLPGEGQYLFLVNVLFNIVGMFIVVAIAGLIGIRMRADDASGPLGLSPPAGDRVIAFLAFVIGGPLTLAAIGGVLAGSGLKVAWGSSMFNFVGLLAIALRSEYFTDMALRRIAISSAVLLTLVPLGYAALIVAGSSRGGAPLRVNWPQAQISKRFVDIWTRETGRPLRIVGGNGWIAGLVGVTAADQPSIFSTGEFASIPWSPWITPERLEREGALIVWDARATWVDLGVPAREERFRSKQLIDGGEIVIRYVLVLPKRSNR